jgi:thioredoxin-dependent peroxiredoxin
LWAASKFISANHSAAKTPFFLVISRGPFASIHSTQFQQLQESFMADWIEPGSAAPSFTLLSDAGKKVKLSDFKGKPVVLYFYPRDDTPGCTQEACAFRDRSSELASAGAMVLGVSTDNVASHEKFRDKYSLNFPLLADEDHAIAEKYGAWREKNMYGKKSWGVQRSTYLIGPDGKVAKVWKKVQVDGHDQQVLDALAELSNA